MGFESSQLRRWKAFLSVFTIKSLMGLTQSCGKNSDWFVKITQSCGKALIGWSQIRKSGEIIFEYQGFATDLGNCDRPIRVLSTTLSNPIRVLFSALQL